MVRKRSILGVIVCVIPIVILSLIFFIPTLLPPFFYTSFYAFIVFFILTQGTCFIGMVLLISRDRGSQFLFSLNILKLLGPPEPIILNHDAVLNRDPVYAFIQWGYNAIRFIAFREPERTFEHKIDAPRLSLFGDTLVIGDVKVARCEGTFTIPTGKDEYHSGDGILYCLFRPGWRRMFTKEQIQRILDGLAKEIGSS